MNEYFDLALLSNPISEESAGGSDIRDDISPTSSYYRVKDGRNTARTNERKRIENSEAYYFEPHDWADVLETAPEIITQQSKDLEIVSWYIEALCRSSGFAGLAFGFKVAEILIREHWDALFPMPDEDGISTRIGPMSGLNGFGGEGTLIMPIKSIPLLIDAEGQPINGWQCQQAFELERLDDPDKKQSRIKSGWIEKSTLDGAVRKTNIDELTTTRQDIEDAAAAFQSLTAAIDAACKDDPQPTSNITNTLKEIIEIFDFVAGSRIKAATPDATAEQPGDDSAEESNSGTTTSAGIGFNMSSSTDYLTQRRTALSTLGQVAEFFRRHEPHSPISYALEKAVKWSDMPLPDLLKELISDDQARQDYFRVTGIPDEE